MRCAETKEWRRYTRRENGVIILTIDLEVGKDEIKADFSIHGKKCIITGEIAELLGKYEDIGLSPSEIRETIDGLNEMIEKQRLSINSLNHRIDQMLEHTKISQEAKYGKK